jgi:outer membrane protein assembly factor BamB
MSAEISNWWMYHGDAQHSGYARSGCGITAANAAGMQLLTSVSLDGPVVSIPSIVDGFVFVGVANYHAATGGNGGAVYKIDVTTGAIAARFTWDLGADLMDGHGFAGMGCSPAVVVPEGGTLDQARVYFSAFNGKVYCLQASDMTLVWQIDLRHADPAMNQPVTNIRGTAEDPVDGTSYSAAAGWSSPLVENGRVYVGIGEGENPFLGSFVFCLDAVTGRVQWVTCTCQFEAGKPNPPNMIPAFAVKGDPLPGFTVYPGEPMVLGCSVWSSIAHSATWDRLYFGTGNAVPDGALPSLGWSNGLMSLDAATGAFAGFFQVMPETNYRPSDNDIDVGASPTVFRRSGVNNPWPGTNPTIDREIVSFACKNGSYFLLDAEKMQLVSWRQLLPYYNNGLQI